MARTSDGASILTESPKKTEFVDGFYHYGMLPASNPVEFDVPDHERQFGQHNDFTKTIKLHPFQLWNGMADGISIYVTKAKKFDTLGVRGFLFPSISRGMEQKGPDLSIIPYAGQIAWLRAEKVKQIIESCFKHFIRYEGQSATVYDMEHGKRPAGVDEIEWRRFSANGSMACPDFDSFTDKYIADFVYLYRMQDAEKEIDRISKDYTSNPNKHHATIAPSVNQKWFDSPMKSVSEMYPQERS